MNNQEKDYGRLENLQLKINKLRQESVDPGFTQYLHSVQTRLDSQVGLAINLENEVNQNYRVYLQHFGASAQQPVAPVSTQPAPTPEVQPQPLQPDPEPAQESQPVQVEVAQPQPAQVVMPQTAYQNVQQVQSAPYAQPVKQKRSMEFTIGTGLFCIVGVLFILASFVMLGMTYMGGLFKSLCLYAMAIVVILISELVFRKRMEKFSLAVTGLGLAGLYASTMINCIYLHNFGNIVAIILTVIISVVTAIMARKKDSGIIKVISFIGCYLCFLPAGKFGTTGEFVTLSIILLLINVFTILLPVKGRAKAVHITHVLSNSVMTVWFSHIALTGGMDGRWVLGFVLSNLIVLGLVYFASWKRGQCSIAVLVNFLIAFLLECYYYTVVMGADIYARTYEGSDLANAWYHVSFAMFAIVMLSLFLLFIKNKYKWIYYYFLVFAIYLTYGVEAFDDSNIIKCVAILAVFVIAKLLSRVKVLHISEIVISVLTMFYAILIYALRSSWSHAFAIIILLSALALHRTKILYQSLISLSTILYLVILYYDFELMPALVVGALFLLLFAFNNVKWWRAENQLVYNVGATAILFAAALLTPVIAGPLNTIIVAVFGTAVIVLMFTDKYEMEFKGKYLVMVLFWTYLVLQTEIEMQLISSLLLMVIAIASVVIGFALKRKEVRVYGLIASLLVCLKVVFYDFSATPIQERMLLFLLIGVIILSISFIYILLEKKTANRGE